MLATYHSTKRIRAGEVIRVSPPTHGEADRGWCIVRASDGGEIRMQYPPGLREPTAGDMWASSDDGSHVTTLPRAEFDRHYISRAGNL